MNSLKAYLLEEAYEVVDAIDRDAMDDLCEELGDLIFEAVFLAQLCDEAGAFSAADAVATVNAKLIRRHPHIFKPKAERDREVNTSGQVVAQWEDIKADERRAAGKGERGTFDGIPSSLPALPRAFELGRRVAKLGFDWPAVGPVVEKLHEELAELEHAAAAAQQPHVVEELGDLLFVVANLARKLDVDPEEALRAANRKFERRFTAMAAELTRTGRALESHALDDMERAWSAVKAAEGVPTSGTRAAPSRRKRRPR